MATRTLQGYANEIQGNDPNALDVNSQPGVTAPVGDSLGRALRMGGPWMRGCFLLLLYMAKGGPGSGQSVEEFLEAASFELDPTIPTVDTEPAYFLTPGAPLAQQSATPGSFIQ